MKQKEYKIKLRFWWFLYATSWMTFLLASYSLSYLAYKESLLIWIACIPYCYLGGIEFSRWILNRIEAKLVLFNALKDIEEMREGFPENDYLQKRLTEIQDDLTKASSP